MIRYSLKCDKDHRFESWFQSASAFDSLSASGHLTCAVCGSRRVAKALMSPGVAPSDKEAGPQSEQPVAPEPMAAGMPAEVVEALQKLRAHVEANSDYVGKSFAREARAMHVGDKPFRPIYGEAGPEEAKALVEDGVPALPLPFIPRQKTN